MSELVEQRLLDRLEVRIFVSEEALGRATAEYTANVLRSRIADQGSARAVFATGNSQLAFIRALRGQTDIAWERVTVFHLDEYVGIHAYHPASFRYWLHKFVVEPFHPGLVHSIEGDASDPSAECLRYEELLRDQPLDLVCIGIGENGHVAFNEPNATDFTDSAWVRVVEVHERSRRQQVGEGHFATIDDVPHSAISLTVPGLLASSAIQVAVPEGRKAEAVRATLNDPVSPACPATILREQAHATLFLDLDSAALIDPRVSSEA